MGGRVTRTPHSGELVRARKLRQALERGASPAFISPGISNPATQPSSLSWSSEKTNFEKTLSPATNSEATAKKTPRKTSPEETLGIRRQYLEQIFQSSPNPVIITERLGACFDAPFFERGTMAFPALSIAHYRLFMERSVGPMQKLVESLAREPQKLSTVRAEFDALVAPYYFDNLVHQDYLLTRAQAR